MPEPTIGQGSTLKLPAPESVDVSSAPTVVSGTVVSAEEEGLDISRIPDGTPVTMRKEELQIIVEGVQDALSDLEAVEQLCDEDEHRALLKLLRSALDALDEAQEMSVSIFETVLAGGNAIFSAPPETPSQPSPSGVESPA